MIEEEEKQGNRNKLKYKWLIKEQKEITKEFLEIAYGSEIIAKLLLNREINTIEKAKAYLNPKFYKESKPEEIPQLVKAKDRIIKAIEKNEKIQLLFPFPILFRGSLSNGCRIAGGQNAGSLLRNLFVCMVNSLGSYTRRTGNWIFCRRNYF